SHRRSRTSSRASTTSERAATSRCTDASRRSSTMPERGFRRVRLIAALTLAGVTGLAGGTLPTVVAEDDAPAITTTVDGTPCPDAPKVDGQTVTVAAGEECPT